VLVIQDFFSGVGASIIRIWSGKRLLWHAVAIALTAVLVLSGADWWFFEQTRWSGFHVLIFAAGISGFFVPVVVPIGLYLYGEWRHNRRLMLMGAAAGQASLLGYLVSIIYKVFTGRTQPEFLTHYITTDISRDFHFGFLQHGIFWGWPSSHAATVFAGAVALAMLCPSRSIRVVSLAYACLVGMGAAIGFHWLSDVVAGVILGSVVGAAVAKSFRADTKEAR